MTSNAASDRVERANDLRKLALVLAVGVFGAAPAIAARGSFQPLLSQLTWIAWVAPALGFLLGALRVALFPWAIVAPAIWMGALALVDAYATRDLPTPVYAALAWTGTFAIAHALAWRRPAWRWSGAAACLALTAAASALPGKLGLADRPWPSELASFALDLSPVALVIECGGVHDWMWQAGNYAEVGIDRFQRRPWRGELAGPALLLLGCAASWWSARASARAAETT